MKKIAIRKNFTEKRKQLKPQEYLELNEHLLAQFKKLDFSTVKCLHIFLPMRSRREPDTLPMIAWLKINQPQIKIVYPKADFTNNTMQHFMDDGALEIKLSDYEIPEPVSGNIVENGEIDMVIVPLLAFDKSGYRVGYGKGFYDRFMAGCKPGTLFVGLSLFDPVDQIDDVDEFDIKLHECISPEKIWKF